MQTLMVSLRKKQDKLDQENFSSETLQSKLVIYLYAESTKRGRYTDLHNVRDSDSISNSDADTDKYVV